MVNKNIFECIYDSGANISCVSLDVIKQLKLNIFKGKNLKFSTINKTHPYLGQVNVNLTIGYKTKNVNLIVIENSKYESLI